MSFRNAIEYVWANLKPGDIGPNEHLISRFEPAHIRIRVVRRYDLDKEDFVFEEQFIYNRDSPVGQLIDEYFSYSDESEIPESKLPFARRLFRRAQKRLENLSV